MVLLHVKTADDRNQFLFETTAKEKIKDIVKAVTSIHLTRLQALKVADAAEALATYGPLRPEETRGLTEEVAKLSNLNVHPDGTPTNPDPHHYRTGVPPPKSVADVIIRTCKEVQEALSHKKVGMRESLTIGATKESLDLLKGALQIAYPAYHGLPSWEPARLILEGSETNGGSEISESITPENACLWWTGKLLQQEESLSKYLGLNEKTKTIVRLQPNNAGYSLLDTVLLLRIRRLDTLSHNSSAAARLSTQKIDSAVYGAAAGVAAGPPVREPRMDAETHKAVIAYCHKKRQEDKVWRHYKIV